MAAAFQTLEQIGAAEAHEAFAGVRQVGENPGLGIRGRRGRRRPGVIAKPVAREVQAVDGVHHVVCEQLRVLRVHVERQRLREACRKIEPLAVFETQVSPPVGLVGSSIVRLDEVARPAYQIQPHQVPPVVSVRRLLKGSQGADRRLMAAHEFRFADVSQQAFRANAQVVVLGNEQAELAGEVQVGLVVGRRRQQDAHAVVFPDVFLYGPVSPAFTVSQMVALINEHQPVSAQVGQLAHDLTDRQDARPHAVLFAVILPHRNEVLRADD